MTTDFKKGQWVYTVQRHGQWSDLFCRSWSFFLWSSTWICLVDTSCFTWLKWCFALCRSRIFCACSSLCVRSTHHASVLYSTTVGLTDSDVASCWQPVRGQDVSLQLASWLIYSYAFKEYISSFGCWSNVPVLFRNVTVSEIRRRKGALFLYFPWKMLK